MENSPRPPATELAMTARPLAFLCRIAFALTVLFWIVPGTPAHAQQDQLSAAQQQRIRSVLETYMRQQDIKGLSFAVGRNDTVLYAGGMGEARPDTPSTAETIYPIGTVSQQFTAGLILYLQRHGLGPGRGDLTVGDSLTEYFYGITHWREATVGNLLTHTSGIPAFTDSVFYRERLFSDVEVYQILDFIKARELKFQPGQDFEYSDSNYFLLANIVEIALEVFFYDQMRTEIFEQLELSDTSFLHLTPLSRRAQGYREDGPVPEVNHRLLMGSADITSTATDLIKWNRAVMRTDYFGDLARRVMLGQFVSLPNINASYGAGWFVRAGQGWSEYFTIGFFPGFTSINKVYHNTAADDHYYVVILTNRDNAAGIEQAANRVFQIIR